MDRAISKYKSERTANYNELVERVRAGLKGAKKAAAKVFGRNAIANALGIPEGSRRLVSESPSWKEIADELGLRRKAKRQDVPSTPKKAGLDIAVEKQAECDGDAVAKEVIRGETLSLLEEAKREAKSDRERQALAALQEQYELGEITDDQARQSLELCVQQHQDDRTRKVPSKP